MAHNLMIRNGAGKRVEFHDDGSILFVFAQPGAKACEEMLYDGERSLKGRRLDRDVNALRVRPLEVVNDLRLDRVKPWPRLIAVNFASSSNASRNPSRMVRDRKLNMAFWNSTLPGSDMTVAPQQKSTLADPAGSSKYNMRFACEIKGAGCVAS